MKTANKTVSEAVKIINEVLKKNAERVLKLTREEVVEIARGYTYGDAKKNQISSQIENDEAFILEWDDAGKLFPFQLWKERSVYCLDWKKRKEVFKIKYKVIPFWRYSSKRLLTEIVTEEGMYWNEIKDLKMSEVQKFLDAKEAQEDADESAREHNQKQAFLRSLTVSGIEPTEFLELFSEYRALSYDMQQAIREECDVDEDDEE